MVRSNAREIAVHLVFGLSYTDEPADQMIESRMEPEYYSCLGDVTDVYAERPDEKQMQYIRAVVTGVQSKRDELDGYVEKYAIGWKTNRISRISMAIMEVAMYEMLYVEDVPVGVAINEAVELCKKYEEAETVSFVNGILGHFAKEVTDHVSGT